MISNYRICKEAFSFFIDIFSTYSTSKYLSKGKTVFQFDDHTSVYINIVTPHLCLMMLVDGNNHKNMPIYDYNFELFKEGVNKLLK